MKFVKLFAPEGQIEIEKIDTQTVVTNQNCLKQNLFDQRKKRKLKFYLQTTLKVEKRHFKSFIQCFICLFYENLF